MSFTDSASGNSLWRGYDYYGKGAVLTCEQTAETEFSGQVRGEKVYSVRIDFSHPRKSSCSCPYANGRRIVCKHMVALYFTAFPGEAERLRKHGEEWEEKEEESQERIYARVRKYIQKMPAAQLRETLYGRLMDSGRYVFERFISEHGLDEWEEEEEDYVDKNTLKYWTGIVQRGIERYDFDFYYDKKTEEFLLDDITTGEKAGKNRKNLLRLPGKQDVDRVRIMRDFAAVQTESVRAELTAALAGKDIDKKFEDAMAKRNIGNLWQAYREERLRLFSEEWCLQNIFRK